MKHLCLLQAALVVGFTLPSIAKAQDADLVKLKSAAARLVREYKKNQAELNEALVASGCTKKDISFDSIKADDSTIDYLENKRGDIQAGPRAPRAVVAKPNDCPNMSSAAIKANQEATRLAKQILLKQLRYNLREFELKAKKLTIDKAYIGLANAIHRTLNHPLMESMDAKSRAELQKTADEFLVQAASFQKTEAGLATKCTNKDCGPLGVTRELLDKLEKMN